MDRIETKLLPAVFQVAATKPLPWFLGTTESQDIRKLYVTLGVEIAAWSCVPAAPSLTT